MAHLSYQQLIDKHLEILRSLQYDTGLFSAADKSVGTGYEKSWLRDNFYETIAFEVIEDWNTVEKTYNAILEILLKHENKIDWAIENKPTESFQYIHARFHPTTFDEFWESWGNKQNDAVGCILFRIGELEHHHNRIILKDENYVRVVNKLVKYLEVIEYWKDRDSGMWEEDEELHASSIGACVAGLESIMRLEKIDVPKELIIKGKAALNNILPRESARKFVDLALLSLIWPYKVVTKEQEDIILENVTYHLQRGRGVIRYKGDAYYNRNEDNYSEEAEWTFGLAWLSIIYELRGEKDKAFEFIKDLIAADTQKGMPELYFSNSPDYNDNTPLGWSESLFIVALYSLERRNTNPGNGNSMLSQRLLLPQASQMDLITYESLHSKIVEQFDLTATQSSIINNDGKMVYAIDLGGDKIIGQAFQSHNGRIRAIGEVMVDKSTHGKGYLAFLEEAADQALKKGLSVGLSVAGPLKGTVLHVGPNMKVFSDEFEAMYKSDFAKLFFKPTVNNDAVAGLKAGAFEASIKYPHTQSVLYIICGSGFGAALLKDSQIFALEPGHIALSDELNAFNIADQCGVFGNLKPCIEKIAAGRAAIETIYERESGEHKSGQEINSLAQKGDELALDLYDHSAHIVAFAVRGILNAFSLDQNLSNTTIVFHGGVFNASGYTDRVEQYLQREFDVPLQLLYTKNIENNACLEGTAIAALIETD